MMGADRMLLISDSIRATGMPDGQYTLGGQDVKWLERGLRLEILTQLLDLQQT